MKPPVTVWLDCRPSSSPPVACGSPGGLSCSTGWWLRTRSRMRTNPTSACPRFSTRRGGRESAGGLSCMPASNRSASFGRELHERGLRRRPIDPRRVPLPGRLREHHRHAGGVRCRRPHRPGDLGRVLQHLHPHRPGRDCPGQPRDSGGRSWSATGALPGERWTGSGFCRGRGFRSGCGGMESWSEDRWACDASHTIRKLTSRLRTGRGPKPRPGET